MRQVVVSGFLLWFALVQSTTAVGQDLIWESMPIESNASLRGLFVLDAEVIWASGTNGTIIHSLDQGRQWHVQQVPGAEKLDFRDLHVFDKQNILAMTSGTPARLYRSADGGTSWKVVFESNDPKVFLDSIAFLNQTNGLVMGDPIDDQLFLLHSPDAGWTWEQVPQTPKLQSGEAGFAASGTNMTTIGNSHWAIGLGGDLPPPPSDEQKQNQAPKHTTGVADVKRSRVVIVDAELKDWRIVETPLVRHASGGIFSLLFVDSKIGVALGGDYNQPDLAQDQIALTNDGGATWTVPTSKQRPTGFRSGVALWRASSTESSWIAVGTNGTDLSSDQGQTWRRVSDIGFNAVQFSADGQTGWAVGSNGRIAKWKNATK